MESASHAQLPIGAHKLLGFLGESLKLLSEHHGKDFNVYDNLREFQDWVCLILAYLFGYFSQLAFVLFPA